MIKNYKSLPFLSTLTLLAILLSSCSAMSNIVSSKVNISIVYGSEKEDWLEPLVKAFNNAKYKTETGDIIVVEATPMGSIETAREINSGQLQPTVWSPASSIYLPVANAEWRQNHAQDLYTGTPKDLVLSPIVIAMWRPMAEALGWPDKALGWSDIGEMAFSEEGWAAYGYPEWGTFKFGHTHPEYSNSGICAVIASTYAGADKQRDLTIEDLASKNVIDFLESVESSIIHYGSSTGFFASRMFERGPSYLSAAVMYENLVVYQETARLSGESQQTPVIAIYPKEGTFWSNHPYVILDANWVTDEQREAAEIFEGFLLDTPQQLLAIEYGFRPSDPSIPLTSPLDEAHGVDSKQPQTILEIPDADVIRGIESLWHEVKKPVDLVLVVDISGSMSGEKINAVRSSLAQFLDLLGDKDQVQVITFNIDIVSITPLTELEKKREDITRRVSGITEYGDTRLYDAVLTAYQELEANGDPDHIRAIVVLSDGQDTASQQRLQTVLATISSHAESGDATKVFTIAYGGDADEAILKDIAEITGGRQYHSDPETIKDIYESIATFF
jgi:Ca-activated chloride channel family protein